MGFDFGKVKTEDRSAAVINAARKAVDDALAEKFTAYIKSFYKGKWKSGPNFMDAIEKYEQTLSLEDGLKDQFIDQYNLFHFEVVDKEVNIIINDGNTLFDNIGSIDFIVKSPIPIRQITGMGEGDSNNIIQESLMRFDLTRKQKDIRDIKKWPDIDAHTITLGVFPKTVDTFNTLMRMVMKHNGYLNVPNMKESNMYMQTGDNLIVFEDEIMAKKNSHILLSEYLYSDNFMNLCETDEDLSKHVISRTDRQITNLYNKKKKW